MERHVTLVGFSERKNFDAFDEFGNYQSSETHTTFSRLSASFANRRTLAHLFPLFDALFF